MRICLPPLRHAIRRRAFSVTSWSGSARVTATGLGGGDGPNYEAGGGKRRISGEECEQVPVVIVGAGPVGLTLSILLSQYGVPSLLVERQSRLPEHPQAHFLNNRTMEIFRKMQGLAEEIEVKQPPVDQWRRFVYCTTLSGPVLGTVDHLRPEDLASGRSPTSVAHFSQHHLLPLLHARAQVLGQKVHSNSKFLQKFLAFTPCPGPILMGHDCASITSSSVGVIARISSQGDARQSVNVACQYLVAADGAGSSIRRKMNVAMKGEADLQQLISVHFLSRDLGQLLLNSADPGMLYFVFNPQVIAVIVAHNLETGEFVAQIPFYPPQQRIEDFTNEVCRDIVWEVAGRRDFSVEIKTVRKWVMHAQVADHYFDRHKRVILAGDAAHRFPPAGGFGLNTGVQDAHNLAWKLAAVFQGHSSRDLLTTYETERQPVARANTALSVANFNAALSVPAALGLDPSAARLVHKVVNSGVGALLPKRIQSAVLDGLFAVGRAQVSPLFLSNFNPIASARISEVQRILKEGHSLQLQFPAEDLGFRYLEGALISDLEEPSKETSEAALTGRRQEYLPSTRPGTRLPHFPIVIQYPITSISPEEACSTLDLITGDKIEFVLIVGCNKSGCRWADMALAASQAYGVSVKVVFIWPSGLYKHLVGETKSSDMVDQGHDEEGHAKVEKDEVLFVYEWTLKTKGAVVHAEEVGSGWWELCNVSKAGAIFIRPDEHVAWRSKSTPQSSSAHDMYNVFAQVLGIPALHTQTRECARD